MGRGGGGGGAGGDGEGANGNGEGCCGEARAAEAGAAELQQAGEEEKAGVLTRGGSAAECTWSVRRPGTRV